MTPQEQAILEKRVELSETRLNDITNLLFTQSDAREAEMTREAEETANFWALYEIVMELAEHAGIDPESFSKHFTIRQQLALDRGFAQVREIDAGTAARLDRRDLDQVPTESFAPSIFDPPTE